MDSTSTAWRTAPCRPTELPPMDLRVLRRTGGELVLRHGLPLATFEPSFMAHIAMQAQQHPHKVAYARRGTGGAVGGAAWETISYGVLHDQVRRVASWFTEREAAGEVLLLLTGNSLAHAVLRLGAIAAGVIVCPVSAGYVAAGGDFNRLAYVLDLVKPRYLFAEHAVDVTAAASLLNSHERQLIVARNEDDAAPASLEAILNTVPGDLEFATDPDAPAAYMLTSGSTGRPKAVVQTQRMLLSNLHQAWQILGSAAGWSDRMLDWLPWSHVSGAFNLYAAAVFGGSLYIDDGKPVAGLFDETISNLREMPLRYFCNVPLGYGMLVEALRRDDVLRTTFYRELRLMLYGGAGLSQPVMDALQGMAVETIGQRIMMTTGYGLTESSSGCMAIYFPTDRVGIGLPLPGVETRLVPLEDTRYEIRLRGPNVLSAYLDNPEASAAAFDEEGFFRTGDAATFHDQHDPEAGLAYAGRLVEEFKLSSGTWVRSGEVRARLLADLSPLASDVLLCGVNRDYLTALLVPNAAALAEIAGHANATDLEALSQHPTVRARLFTALEKHVAALPGSSTTVRRAAFMRQPPDAQRHEISDKGTINQRIAAQNRDDEIEALYASDPPPHVVVAP
ncbi:MAG: AMP-binding protein [Pseudomonadota bacterium]